MTEWHWVVYWTEESDLISNPRTYISEDFELLRDAEGFLELFRLGYVSQFYVYKVGE